MPDRRTEDDRHAEQPQNSRADFPHRGSSGNGRLAIRKVSEHNPAHAVKFSSLLQMHQNAIYLVGFHSAVFEDQNRIPGVQFPWRADCGLQQRHASA